MRSPSVRNGKFLIAYPVHKPRASVQLFIALKPHLILKNMKSGKWCLGGVLVILWGFFNSSSSFSSWENPYFWLKSKTSATLPNKWNMEWRRHTTLWQCNSGCLMCPFSPTGCGSPLDQWDMEVLVNYCRDKGTWQCWTAWGITSSALWQNFLQVVLE